ncbi:MAG TPA: DUF805 domain-containing protein [Sphingomicrobium sp.]
MRDRPPIEWALLPLKKYASFRGRAPRAEYWWFCLLAAVGWFILTQVGRAAGAGDALAFAFDLAMVLPWLGVTVRRLHDAGRSGRWLLLFVVAWVIITLIGYALGSMDEPSESVAVTAGITIFLIMIFAVFSLLALMVLPGSSGTNRFGPDPYGPDPLEDVFA